LGKKPGTHASSLNEADYAQDNPGPSSSTANCFDIKLSPQPCVTEGDGGGFYGLFESSAGADNIVDDEDQPACSTSMNSMGLHGPGGRGRNARRESSNNDEIDGLMLNGLSNGMARGQGGVDDEERTLRRLKREVLEVGPTTV
jgi:hypothetical protein